jgi:hypothetical protein
MQLKVIKADGSTEQYLHTKVIGAISNALSQIDRMDISVTEHLAEVVTYFLYNKNKPLVVTSNEILSVVKAVLAGTGYEDAAIVLSEHYYQRKLKRSRTEVVELNIRKISDAHRLAESPNGEKRSRWEKSEIVSYLVTRHDLCRQAARTVAGMVEERIFNMGITLVPVSLVKQLVLGDAAAILRAERQLQSA